MAHLQKTMLKCDFRLDIEVGDPGVIIIFSSPAEIHRVLGQLPAV